MNNMVIIVVWLEKDLILEFYFEILLFRSIFGISCLSLGFLEVNVERRIYVVVYRKCFRSG